MPNAYFGSSYDPATITDNTRCDYCGRSGAKLVAVDGKWCGDAHQRYDRQSETRMLTTGTATYGRHQ